MLHRSLRCTNSTPPPFLQSLAKGAKLVLADWHLLAFCFFSTFLLGLAAHAFIFFNLTLSHDSLVSFFASQEEIEWKLALGRFLVPVYQVFFRGKLALPWLIGFLSLVYLSATAYMLSKLFNITEKLAIFSISGVLCVNLTIIAQAGTYLFELDCNMLALLLCVCAVCVWKHLNGIGGFLLASLFMFCSMGIYQSYVSVAVTLIAMICIIELSSGKSLSSILLYISKAIGLILLAFAVYSFVVNRSCAAFHVTLQDRVNVFAFPKMEHPFFYLWNLFTETYSVFYDLCVAHRAYTPIGGISLMSILAVTNMLTIFFILFLTVIYKKNLSLFNKLLCIACTALLPFCMNSIYFLTRGFIHELMIYSYWLMFPFCIALAQNLSKNVSPHSRTAVATKLISAGIAVLFIWQNLILANTFYVKKELEAQSTLFTMTRVVSSLEQQQDYVPGQTPVVFIGRKNTFASTDVFAQTRHIVGGTSRSAITYYQTYSPYFTYILNYPINLANVEVHNRMLESPRVKEMPAFPLQGSIQLVDGIMIIKLN